MIAPTSFAPQVVERIQNRGVPLNSRTKPLVNLLVGLATSYDSTGDILRAYQIPESTARWRLSKIGLPGPSRIFALGRALHIAAEIQTGKRGHEVGEQFGYADHSGVSVLLTHTLGVGIGQVRKMEMGALLERWIDRELPTWTARGE